MEKRAIEARQESFPMAQVELPINRIHLEVTNQCNFDCAFCPDHKMQRRRGSMPLEQATRLLDEIAQHGMAEEVRLHLMGEPFLHPKLMSIIEHGARQGLYLSLTTNASLLTERNVERLLGSGLSELVVSLQTPDAESFALRNGPPKLKFETYEAKVRHLLERCLERDMPFRLNLNFLNTTSQGLLGRFREPIRILDGNRKTRKALLAWGELALRLAGREAELDQVRAGLERVSVNRWETLEILPGLVFEVRPLFDWGNAWTPTDEVVPATWGTCNAVREQLGILYDGRVVLCCADYDGATSVGNALEDSLMSILASDKVAGIVSAFRRNRVVHPRCQQCLGGETRLAALSRQAGSIFFFKLGGRRLQKKRRLHS